ncbi:C40 family peptidase [Gordonia sp. (in: high G+C Gram-positive bacteria)]|uniref:C40 family peptidase n=1 Tax=Gordonia sp. (in: high G+C Gram-positive bacteria) TaxID=84139 RepID=UPI0016B4B457|nr:C40 family peptidase [Gordonia sp. (in: high G+C Gram-positive bacteria)]NLG47833.1 C40 family peptidase [Gordonia sp. (in: high G+C Gram-positive bacteria)]
MSAALLIAPLKALVATLGTGVLPPGVAGVYSDTAAALGQSSALSSRGAASIDAGWRGNGGEQAATATRRLAVVDDAVGTAGTDISTVIEAAAGRVKAANTELNALVESFVKAASAVPAVTSPAGLAALVPLAMSHLARGVQVIARTQSELTRDASDLGRHQAPAELTGPTSDDALPATATGRIPIRLPDGSISYAPNERAAKAIRAALSVQGTPYVWGGTSTDGFDCSGFTQWAYRQAGLELPRLAQDQDTAGFQVSQSQLQPGDLAVWSGHVAMYIGNGQMVETGGDPVGVNPLRTTNAGQTFEGFYRPR